MRRNVFSGLSCALALTAVVLVGANEAGAGSVHGVRASSLVSTFGGPGFNQKIAFNGATSLTGSQTFIDH